MNAVRRVLAVIGRALFVGGGVLALLWGWRLYLGLMAWEGEFHAQLPESSYRRSVMSPFFPLLVAAVALLLLAVGRSRRRTNRVVGAVAGLSAYLAMAAPMWFYHDLGHTVLRECSNRLELMHITRCAVVLGTAFVGLVLVESDCGLGEPVEPGNRRPTPRQ